MSSRDSIESLRRGMRSSIIGQDDVVDRLLLTLLCDGNALLEGLPGLAKTRAIKTLSACLESKFSRIQFTPDLLPADITGSEIYLGENASERFEFQPGPIFANLVLADEINRSPAKVQAALLEAMEERQVTVAGKSHRLPKLFMVLATQNPVEQEGTYPLPEAQMDRFLMHVTMTYPDDESERKIVRLVRGESDQSVDGDQDSQSRGQIPQSDIFEARSEIDQIEISDSMEQYLVALIAATRRPKELDNELGKWIQIGASPRGSIALDKTSRAFAWLHERSHVIPDDLRAVIHDCLRHRLTLSYEAAADGVGVDDVISRIIQLVPVA
ncbi:MAG: MoxR family ATPase [Planctomycetota bacterium]